MILLLLGLVDTLRVTPADRPLAFDGRVSEAEYGAPTLELARPAGTVRVWARSDGPWVILAVQLADPTPSWQDDVVLSLDTGGDRAPGPMHDDFQWYFRRVLDSSVVYRGEAGKWRAPRDDPDWRLGAARDGGGWEVRAASDSAGWSLELRLDRAYFNEAREGRLPGVALRVFDDDPQGWQAWPAAAGLRHPTELEQRPALWAPVSFTP